MKIWLWHTLKLRQKQNIGLFSLGCLLTQKTQKKRVDSQFLLLLEMQKEGKMGIQSAPILCCDRKPCPSSVSIAAIQNQMLKNADKEKYFNFTKY